MIQIAESSKLVGDLEDLSCLEAEYASDDHVYQAKIKVRASPVNLMSTTCRAT